MDDKLKTIKYPLVFFYNKIKNKSKISDEQFRLLFVKVITYHQDYFLDLNIVPLFLEIKDSHPQTWKIVKVYQKVLRINIENFKLMRKYRETVNKKLFNSSIENQINVWNKKLDKIKSLDDSSYGECFSIKMLLHNNENKIYENEMILRLIKIKDILGLRFFIKNNIILFYYDDFLNFNWSNKTKIYFKLIKNIKNKLNEIIKLLNKTKNYLNILNEIYQIIQD